MSPPRGPRLVLLALAFLSCCPFAGASPTPTDRVLADLERRHLPLPEAHEVEDLELPLGPARLILPTGRIYWTPAIGGRGAEAVLIGEGRILLPAVDPIEGEQMRLFTGAETLDATFQKVVLTVADRSLLASWIEKTPPIELDPAVLEDARSLLGRWKQSPERERLQVDGALLRAAEAAPLRDTNDADHESFLTAWFLDTHLGDFLLRLDPSRDDPFWIGQLVRPDPDLAATRRLQRLLHQQQRQGRWSRLDLGDLGLLDTWTTSASSTHSDPRPPPVVFHHYQLDLELESERGFLRGTARVELQRVEGSGRVVSLLLHPDLEVLDLRDSLGRALSFLRRGDQIHVVLQNFLASGTADVLEISYAGPMLEALPDRGFALRDTVSWHPRGLGDRRSTWDVTLRWPVGLDLVASGRVTDSGRGLRRRWERRRLDVPSSGFGFVLGDFAEQTREVGDLKVSFAFDSGLIALSGGQFDAVIDTVEEALDTFTRLFGPLDINHLQVVTQPRASSQTLGGFITLSDPMVADWGALGKALGLEDRRLVVAHEIAHLWWGERMPWAEESDRWLAEALANTLAAMAIAPGPDGARAPRLEAPPPGLPDPLWRSLRNGRYVAEAGPPVLGRRLDSSLTLGRGAEDAILYGKGTKILQTLAERVGPAVFRDALTDLARDLRSRPFSTPAFRRALEDRSGQDLAAFFRRFVYGDGLETVLYRWGYRSREDGRFALWIETEPELPPRVEFRLRSDGTLLRQTLEPRAAEAIQLRIPLQILLAEDGSRGTDKERRLLTGHIEHHSVEGSRLELLIDERPEQLWLDLEQKTLTRCFDLGALPGLELLDRGRRLVAAGDLAGAGSVLQAALDATPDAPANPGALRRAAPRPGPDDLREQIRHELFRVRLELGEIEAAEQILARLRQEADPRSAGVARVSVAEAHLALRRNHPKKAYAALTGSRADLVLRDDPEPLLLLALAARASGRRDESERALRRARHLGAEIEPLP